MHSSLPLLRPEAPLEGSGSGHVEVGVVGTRGLLEELGFLETQIVSLACSETERRLLLLDIERISIVVTGARLVALFFDIWRELNTPMHRFLRAIIADDALEFIVTRAREVLLLVCYLVIPCLRTETETRRLVLDILEIWGMDSRAWDLPGVGALKRLPLLGTELHGLHLFEGSL